VAEEVLSEVELVKEEQATVVINLRDKMVQLIEVVEAEVLVLIKGAPHFQVLQEVQA
jgi:hypothetical protein